MVSDHADILLVEDDEAHAELVSRAFGSSQDRSNLTVAGTLGEARRLLEQEEFDLVVVDYLLPDGTGLELLPGPGAESVRPVVIITSHGDEKVAVEAMKAGALDYVAKTEATLADMPHVCQRAMREWRHITGMKRMEQEKARLEKELRHSQKMEAVGTLAGGIAHDFNNILAAIMGYTEIALIDARQGQVNPRDLKQILSATDRARNLVRQILTFSRKVDVELKPLEVNQLILGTVRLLKRTIPKMIKINANLTGPALHVKGEAGQLEQVLMNLGTNAKDAMPEGGTLLLQAEKVILNDNFCAEHIEVAPGAYVRIRVKDSGCGMDQQTRRQIFDPFFTTKQVGSGTGLGLSTAFGIIKNHRGHINCQSQPGDGTTFDIFLPELDGPEKMDAEKQPLAKIAPGGTETVLLVDDEPNIRDIGRRLLTQAGYRILSAANGEQALDIFREPGRNIALVILDLSMPGMGGHRCFEELKKMNPDQKIIISSGYFKEDQTHPELRAKASAFLAKPISGAALLQKVRQVLDQ